MTMKQFICRIRGYHREEFVTHMTRVILGGKTGRCATCHAKIEGFGQ